MRKEWIGVVAGVAIGSFILYSDLFSMEVKSLLALALMAYSGVRIFNRNVVITRPAVWGIVVMVVLVVGSVVYAYVDARRSERPVLRGKFEVMFFDWKFPGTAKLEDNGKRLILQFKVPTRVFVKSFRLDSIPAAQQPRLNMVCALRENFDVAHCTTDSVKGFTNLQNSCLENGVYTTSLWFYEPLEVESLEGLAFSVFTSRGDNTVVVKAN